MTKILLVIIWSFIWIFIWVNYVYIYENDCIELNVDQKSIWYLIWNFENQQHYAEYHKNEEKYYVFDEATWNTWKELNEYLKENNWMQIWKKYTLEYLYFLYTKTFLANFIKKWLT